MPEWKRVRAKNGAGHEFSVQVVDPARHEPVPGAGADKYGRPLPVKYATKKPADQKPVGEKPSSKEGSK